MRCLFIASEVEPYSKTGGLADVLGALPRALAARGHACLVVSPRYGTLDVQRHGLASTGKTVSVAFPFGHVHAEVLLAEPRENLRFAFLEHRGYYDRSGIYGDRGGDYGDNARRFGFLSRAALEVCRALDFTPDIVHAHDWQAGLVPLFLAEQRADPRFAKARSVLTIHNLGYQGVFGKEVMWDSGLSWRAFTLEGLELHDWVSFLKAGINFSDAITTVSPRYAQEIQTPDQGWGLDGALRARHHRLTGILNGVDYADWNPEADPLLPAPYGRDKLAGKTRCHRSLCETFGLELGPQTLLLGMVTRLAYQKGADLLLEAAQGVLEEDVALVVLGSGDPREEEGFRALERAHRGRVGAYIGFHAGLSRLVIAGSDALVMPSRYEPCGLSQLYGLRYGTVPIVRATGGLDDTVVDASQADGTGFKFEAFQAGALVHAVHRAAQLFRQREAWIELMRRGMARDFSWDASSQRYEQLFAQLLSAGA